MAGNRTRALKSYDKAHAWKELFTLAKLEKLPEDEMQDLVQRIASAFPALYLTVPVCR
jgi:elongator complex protein 1